MVAVEETQDTIYLVLPSTPMADGEGEELTDQQLESVAGAGWVSVTYASDVTCGSESQGVLKPRRIPGDGGLPRVASLRAR